MESENRWNRSIYFDQGKEDSTRYYQLSFHLSSPQAEETVVGGALGGGGLFQRPHCFKIFCTTLELFLSMKATILISEPREDWSREAINDIFFVASQCHPETSYRCGPIISICTELLNYCSDPLLTRFSETLSFLIPNHPRLSPIACRQINMEPLVMTLVSFFDEFSRACQRRVILSIVFSTNHSACHGSIPIIK